MAKLLIVDDDSDILDYLRTILTTLDHEIRVEKDAKNAIRIMDQYQPDLIITDIFMPDMDGFELIKIIRKSHKNVKILGLSAGGSGFSQDLTLVTAKDFGANAVMKKPIEQHKIINMINDLLSP